MLNGPFPGLPWHAGIWIWESESGSPGLASTGVIAAAQVLDTPNDMTTTEIPIIQYGVSNFQKYRLAESQLKMLFFGQILLIEDLTAGERFSG